MREFTIDRVNLLELPPHTPRGVEARLHAIVQASYQSRRHTEKVRIRLAEARANRNNRALAVTAGGESGHPASPHFDDQAERFVSGRLREVYFHPWQLTGHTERVYHPGE